MRRGTGDKGQVRSFLPVSCLLSPVSSQGFSLIELIVSLAILSVGLVGSVRVFPVGLRASQRSERSSRAAIAAQRTIECLKLTPWDALVEEVSASPCDTLTGEEGPSEEADYTVTTRITEPEVEALVDPTRLKMIEVTVEWLQDGRSRSQSFVTYLRRPDEVAR